MIFYGIAVPVFATRVHGAASWLVGYVATFVIIMTVVSDSRRAIDRRFKVLIEVLEKKGVL